MMPLRLQVTIETLEYPYMAGKLSAKEVLDREFLEIRCRVLDIAAALDRVQRGEAPEEVRSDPRMAELHEALDVVRDGKLDRATRVQMVFSDAYDESWRAT